MSDTTKWGLGIAAVLVVVLLVWQPWKKKAVQKSHIPAIVQVVTA